jgi:hypothetical protein
MVGGFSMLRGLFRQKEEGKEGKRGGIGDIPEFTSSLDFPSP